MNILKRIQYLLVWIKVVKHEGKRANGQYLATGINRKNPLSYIVVFMAAIVVGILAFCKEFIDTWKSYWYIKLK